MAFDDEFDLNVGTLSNAFEGLSRSLTASLPPQGTPSRSDRGGLFEDSTTEPTAEGSPLEGESLPSPFVDTHAVLASAPSRRKFKLWWVPEEKTELVCGTIIGQGHAFCTISNCSKNHRQQRFCTILPGEVYVQKSNDLAFIWPSAMTTPIDSSLLKQWRTESHTLEKWLSIFSLIGEGTASPSFNIHEDIFSGEDLREKVKEEKEVLSFKTPRPKKRKATLKEDPEDDIKESFENLFEGVNEVEGLKDASIIATLFKELDKRSITLLEAVKLHLNRYQRESATSVASHHNADVRLTNLSRSIGERPLGMDEQFEAPTLWLTLATVASELKEKLDEVKQDTENVKASWSMFAKDPPLKSSDFSKRAAPFAFKIKEVEKFAIDSVQMLSKKFISPIPPPAPTIDVETLLQSPQFLQREKELLNKIQGLESDIIVLRSANDSESIKFSNLGFRNKTDCDAWVSMHHPGTDFGFIMDFHLVMAHVHHAISGTSLMDNLHKVHRMHLSHNHQAVALGSYEARVPKYFVSKTAGYNIVRRDESYFSAIKSWDDWDLPNDGFRDRLDKFVTDFEEGFGKDLDAAIAPNSLFHTVATKALSTSVHWVRGLSKFMDDTYNEYHRAHYSGKTAWYITTRLARALIEYVGIPRNTIHNTFRIDFPDEIAKSMFYASTQSLDKMAEVSSKNFKNSPIVMGELTKFLALNSNYELVGKLHSKVNEMKESVAEAVKESAASSRAASTLASKFESHCKKPLEILTKRVDKLEKK